MKYIKYIKSKVILPTFRRSRATRLRRIKKSVKFVNNFFKTRANKRFYKIIVFLFLFFVLFILVYIFSSKIKTNIETDASGCFWEEEKIVQGDSMEPILLNGKGIVLLKNYYQCGNLVEKGDIISYNYSGNANPLIKIVKVTDQDEVEIIDNKLKVNGEILKNSGVEEYIFSETGIRMLSLYVKNGCIPKDSFLIFGDNVQDSTDSRKFGAVSAVDFLGKFVFDN